MKEFRSKTIILTAIAMMSSLTLLLASTTLNGYSQEKPDFPSFDSLFSKDSQSSNTQNSSVNHLRKLH